MSMTVTSLLIHVVLQMWGGQSKGVNLALTCALGEQRCNLLTNRHDSHVGRLIWGMDDVMQYSNFIGRTSNPTTILAREVDMVSEERGGGDDTII